MTRCIGYTRLGGVEGDLLTSLWELPKDKDEKESEKT